MAIIPDFTPVPGRHTPAAPSVGAAMAPGMGLAKAGNSISQAGETGSAIAMHMQESRDQGVKNKARLMMQEAAAEHERFRLNNPDETTWAAHREQGVMAVKEKLANEKISPFAKAELDAEFNGWQSESKSRTMLDAENHRIARDRTNYTRLDRLYQESGDHESRRKLVEENTGKLFTKEEAEVNRKFIEQDAQEWEKSKALDVEKAKIAEDPNYDGFKNHPDPVERQQLTSYQRSLIGQQRQDVADSVRDGIAAGKITRPDQIDALAEDAGPRVTAALKAELQNMSDDAFKQLAATPGYQSQVIGQVTEKMIGLDPNDRETVIETESLIRQLPDGPSKSHLTNQLRKKINGEPEEMTVLNMNLKMADEFYQVGGFGQVKLDAPQKVSDAIGDDFLRDTANLKALGADDAQAKAIADEKSNELRTAKFRDLFPQFTGKKTADDYKQRAAKAIIERKDEIPGDPAATNTLLVSRHKARTQLGALKKHMTEWAASHPKDAEDDAKVRAEMARAIGPARHGALIDSAIQFNELDSFGVLPTREEMAAPATPLDLPEP